MSHVAVAIDGPAGSGKSSVSKAVARQLGWGYLDTGAAYRALTLAVTRGLVPNASDLENLNLGEVFRYTISTDPSDYWVRLGDTEVTDDIRSAGVAETVSQVAKIPSVRAFMKKLTRDLVSSCELPGIVVEGRDITTVVLPDAQVRLLLTASEEVRLKRRSSELGSADAQQVARQVSQRDASDAKVVDFMTPADGVTLVDSTNLNFDQTVSAIVAIIAKAIEKDS
ncbi:MAG: (d)CMP kinase [Micrococcales bacterium]